MSGTFTSPEMVINDALKRIGLKIRIGSVWDGSEPAKHALDIYAQTRDAQLRLQNPDFAEYHAAAVASTVSPPPQWPYAYDYPADCITVRQLFPSSYLVDQNNPLPANWTVAGALSGMDDDQVRVIFASFSPAKIVYTRRVTDPSAWDQLFTESLCAALARRLFPAFSDNPNLEKVGLEDEQASDTMAQQVVG